MNTPVDGFKVGGQVTARADNHPGTPHGEGGATAACDEPRDVACPPAPAAVPP